MCSFFSFSKLKLPSPNNFPPPTMGWPTGNPMRMEENRSKKIKNNYLIKNSFFHFFFFFGPFSFFFAPYLPRPKNNTPRPPVKPPLFFLHPFFFSPAHLEPLTHQNPFHHQHPPLLSPKLPFFFSLNYWLIPRTIQSQKRLAGEDSLQRKTLLHYPFFALPLLPPLPSPFPPLSPTENKEPYKTAPGAIHPPLPPPGSQRKKKKDQFPFGFPFLSSPPFSIWGPPPFFSSPPSGLRTTNNKKWLYNPPAGAPSPFFFIFFFFFFRGNKPTINIFSLYKNPRAPSPPPFFE